MRISFHLGLLLVPIWACGPQMAQPPVEGSSSQGSSSSSGLGEASSSGQLPTTSTQTQDSGTTGPADCSTGDGFALLPCKTWSDDCPECYKCMPYIDDGTGFWNNMGCVLELSPSKKVGEPCVLTDAGANGAHDDCERGLYCLDGECSPFCVGEDFSCPSTHVCVNANDVYVVCYARCDPLGPSCAPGKTCVRNGTYGYFVCVDAVEENGEFESCDDSAQCASGLGCFPGVEVAAECMGEVSCCGRYCDLDAPLCVGGGQKCVPFFSTPEFPEYLRLGVCVVDGG